MNPRLVDWIWHVRGSLALPPGQSSEDALDRLGPLFHEAGTSHERSGGMLTFRKKDQGAQDKMSVFDDGVLRVEHEAAGPMLRYQLTSRALLFCFLAPLLFLAFAQLTVVAGKFQDSGTEAADKAKKEAEAKKAQVPMNPIDKFLGAPEPEKPGTKDKKEEEDDKKPSPTAAYVFAGIFAALYLIGRILEDRSVKKLFSRRLVDA